MGARYQTILFDADDTLFDFEAAEHQALCHVLGERNYPTDEETLSCYLRINRELWRRFDRGEITCDYLGRERFRRFIEQMGGDHEPERLNRDYLSALAKGSRLLPGAENLCSHLAPYCRMVIATNGMTAAQTGRVQSSGIRDYISGLFISQEMGCQKPQKEFYHRVYSALGLSEEDLAATIMVGDSLTSDILGGIHGGIDTLWYNPKGMPQDPGIRPTWEVSDYGEIEQIILGEQALR